MAAQNKTKRRVLTDDQIIQLTMFIDSPEFERACDDKFNDVDLDGSGILEVPEIYKVLCRMYEEIKVVFPDLVPPTMADAHEAMIELDTDKSGVVERNEFVVFCKAIFAAMVMGADIDEPPPLSPRFSDLFPPKAGKPLSRPYDLDVREVLKQAGVQTAVPHLQQRRPDDTASSSKSASMRKSQSAAALKVKQFDSKELR